jgi:hypothetical protein
VLLVACFFVTGLLVTLCVVISIYSRNVQHARLPSDVAEATLSKQTLLLHGPTFVAPVQPL